MDCFTIFSVSLPKPLASYTIILNKPNIFTDTNEASYGAHAKTVAIETPHFTFTRLIFFLRERERGGEKYRSLFRRNAKDLHSFNTQQRRTAFATNFTCISIFSYGLHIILALLARTTKLTRHSQFSY